MSSVAVAYSVAADTYQFAYLPYGVLPGMQAEGDFSDGVLVPEGDWTALASPFRVDFNSGIGLILRLESGEVLEFLAHTKPLPDLPNIVFAPFPGRQITLRVEHYDEMGILVFSYSEDLLEWTEVASFSPGGPVSEVGVVLRYDNPDHSAGGMLGTARLLNGIWQNVFEEVWLGEPEVGVQRRAARAAPEVTVTSTSEPLVHVIVGAQFGDLEFDVGKSVRWVTWFCDNVFVLDVNLGTPRYWIVNWAETFPNAKHTITGINYFYSPANAALFRAEQWKQYKLAFGVPEDSDWVLFLDAHEGLSVDNRSLPDDYDFVPFKSFLWREIQRAQDASQSSAVLPFYVFLRSDHITNVTYGVPVEGVPPVLQSLSVPYYQAHQGQRRLWNAAALRAPDFDWTQIDTPVAPSVGAKAQILSYGYAHWNLQDIEPPATTVPPLTEANDDGWRMRKLLSRVRPVPGLPVGDTWISPSSDPVGLPGPWAPADANNPDPIDPDTGAVMSPPVPPHSSLEGLVTPLYDCVFRLNMRDGVWYEENLSGNIPLRWDDDAQDWTTDYDPALWADKGVKSYDPTAVT